MEKNTNKLARYCNGCGIELTPITQSAALARNRRKLCSKCGSLRSASYAPRYKEAQSVAQRLRRAEHAKLRVKTTPLDRLKAKMLVLGPDDCWPWLGAVSKQTGYGMFRMNKTTVAANRAVLELISGLDMSGLVSRHKCDNRICVNPAHLEPGTQAENMRDAVIRNRVCKEGAKVAAALNAKVVARRKLTEDQALLAFNLVNSGKKRIDVAMQFGVTKSNIDKMMLGDAWSHITGLTCRRHTWNNQARLDHKLDHKPEHRAAAGGKTY